MMLLAIAFVLVLIVSFVSVMLLTRPSQVEKAIDSRLAQIYVSDDLYQSDGTPTIFKRTQLSDIAWVDKILQRLPAAHAVRQLLAQADSHWTVGQVLSVSLLLGLLTYLLVRSFVSSVALAALLALLASALPVLILRVRRERRLNRFTKALPDAIDIIARSLRAGHSLSAAMEIVADQAAEPVRSEFRTVCRQQNLGLPFREAVLQILDRVPSTDLQLIITGMLVQKETGGNLVEILDRTNNVIRERVRLEGEMRVYTAQGRLTAWILGLLPVGLYLMISLVNPGYARILITDPTGQKMLAGGVVQIIIGMAVIRRIVKVKV